MSSGTPYIGSKISLVSKAKIRYEGFLYTIDQQESTVTLAKVRSLGTEERVPHDPVPAREEIFEYIVFRGHDIEDLHVCEAPATHVDDPAIVHNGPIQSTQNFQNRNAPFQPPSYAPFGGGMPAFGYPFPQSGGHDHPNRMPTPPTLPRTPTPDGSKQSVKDNRSQSNSNQSKTTVGKSERKESTGNRNKENAERRSNYDNKYKERRDNRDTNKSNRKETGDRREYRDNRDSRDNNDQRYRRDNNRYNYRDKDSNYRREDKDSNYRREDKESNYRRDDKESSYRRDDKDGNYRRDDKDRNERSSQNDRRGSARSRGTRGSGGGGKTSRGGGSTREKFTEDFDFETSNAKFHKEEIEKELLKVLNKTKITEDEPEQPVKELEEKDEDDLDPLPSPDKFYDRSKSFFDNISCEAMGPKAKPTTEEPVMTRRQERALNTETFGTSGYYRRGGYRGRGYGRGRGRGRGRGGWRGRGSRGRSSNQNWVDYEFDYEAAGIKSQTSKTSAGS